jgi:hypothetical protein
VGIAAEGELEHLHPREVVLITQRFNGWGDDAKVLSDDRQQALAIATKLALKDIEDRLPGAIDPATTLGGRFVGGNLPVGLEGTKMVDAQKVNVL